MKEALIGSSSMPSISCLCHGVELLVRRNALEIEDASAAPPAATLWPTPTSSQSWHRAQGRTEF